MSNCHCIVSFLIRFTLSCPLALSSHGRSNIVLYAVDATYRHQSFNYSAVSAIFSCASQSVDDWSFGHLTEADARSISVLFE
jgi:hypothetical protein